MQTGLGFTRHREPALEEQRVGILVAQRQRREVLEAAAEGHVRARGAAAQPRRGDLERQRERYVVDPQPEALASELGQPRLDRLAAQQPVDQAREHVLVQGGRRQSQQRAQQLGGLGHGNLRPKVARHSCHEAAGQRLTCVKESRR